MNGLAARFGGEEFTVVLPSTSSQQVIDYITCVQNQLATLNIEHLASEVATQVTVSIGFELVETLTNRQASDILSNADKALYNAKQAGRNRYSQF